MICYAVEALSVDDRQVGKGVFTGSSARCNSLCCRCWQPVCFSIAREVLDWINEITFEANVSKVVLKIF
jgi:hypothetical protein